MTRPPLPAEPFGEGELRNTIQAIIFDAATQYANNGSNNFYDVADEIIQLIGHYTAALLARVEEEVIGKDEKVIGGDN